MSHFSVITLGLDQAENYFLHRKKLTRNSIRCKYLHSIKYVAVGDAGKYFKCTGQPQDPRLGETSDALFLPSLCIIGLGMHSTELVLPGTGSQGTLPHHMERNCKRFGVRNWNSTFWKVYVGLDKLEPIPFTGTFDDTRIRFCFHSLIWPKNCGHVVPQALLLFSLVQVSSPKPKLWTKAEHETPCGPYNFRLLHPPTYRKLFEGF